MKRIVLFASGSGSNVENIINYFKNHKNVEISHVFVNNPKAFVIERSKKLNVPYTIFNRKDFVSNGKVLAMLKSQDPDLIVLAGFLWLVPSEIIMVFVTGI